MDILTCKNRWLHKIDSFVSSNKNRVEIVGTGQDAGFIHVIENVKDISNSSFQAEVIARSSIDTDTGVTSLCERRRQTMYV